MPKPAELADLEQLLEEGHGLIEAREVCTVRSGTEHFPVYAIALGSTDPSCPGLGCFWGIHGLERDRHHRAALELWYRGSGR